MSKNETYHYNTYDVKSRFYAIRNSGIGGYA